MNAAPLSLLPTALAASPSTPTPGSDPDTLMTADDLAALLQVTPAWVYAETRKRRIPHLRLGRYVRYRRSAIDAWIQDVERSSARTSPPRRRR
jgi:excisionase family DNA binding protein